MAITVEELLSRLNAEAARRHMSPEELLEMVAAQLPSGSAPDEWFGFAGKGHSGRGDLSERDREIRAELIAEARGRHE